MQSGKLNKRFTILTYTDALNDYGEDTPPQTWSEWATFATVWGSLKATTGKETDLSEKITSEITHNIKIRYLTGLLPLMAFKLGTRYFNIINILADPKDARSQIVRVTEKIN